MPQWFWSSVVLTGNETARKQDMKHIKFWSSVVLTGNETDEMARIDENVFWSSVVLTGNETIACGDRVID